MCYIYDDRSWFGAQTIGCMLTSTWINRSSTLTGNDPGRSVLLKLFGVGNFSQLEEWSFKFKVHLRSSVQPEIAPLFTIYFQKTFSGRNPFRTAHNKPRGDVNSTAWWCRAGPLSILIFKIWQLCDWLTKSLIMLGLMALRRPRISRRSTVGLVNNCGCWYCWQVIGG